MKHQRKALAMAAMLAMCSPALAQSSTTSSFSISSSSNGENFSDSTSIAKASVSTPDGLHSCTLIARADNDRILSITSNCQVRIETRDEK